MEPENKEKSIKEYEEEIEQLKMLNETLQTHVDLKEAQSAIYKQDFEAERNDRQRIHAECETLRTRMEESWAQHEVDRQAIDNLGEIIKTQEEEIKVLKGQLHASVNQNQEDRMQALRDQVQDLQIKFSNERERLLNAYHQEKRRADRLEKQIEQMKEANNVQTRSRRSYSCSSSHHYDSDSFSPPPFAHQSVSDPSQFPFIPTPSPSPHVNERMNKPGTIREEAISRHHDYTTSIPSHIRPQFSKEEMCRRFGGGRMRREEYERSRVLPAYTTSIPKSVRPQLSEEEMKNLFKPAPRMSPAYTSSIPDSVKPQVSEEEMKRRFKNHQQPYNQYRREDSEEYFLRVNEEADQALLEVDHSREQNPIHP